MDSKVTVPSDRNPVCKNPEGTELHMHGKDKAPCSRTAKQEAVNVTPENSEEGK